MKVLLNKQVLVEFDKLPDGNYSAIYGMIVDWLEVGIAIKNNNDGKVWFLKFDQIFVLKEV